MKLLLPVENNEGLSSRVCDHFGSAPCFLIADTDNGSVALAANANCEHDHGSCNPVDALGTMKVDAVICRGIGSRAATRLQMSGIAVYIAGSAATAADALTLFNSGALTKAGPEMTCAGHGCH